MERIQYLKQMYIPPLRNTDASQVYAFFDVITLAHTNYTNMNVYREGIGYPGQEIDFPGNVIKSHLPGYQIVPVVRCAFNTECAPETLIQFLQQTQENNKRMPFGVMIEYINHATSIGFDGKKWLASDHDVHYYTEHTDLLCKFLGRQSHRNKNRKMDVRVYVVAANEHSLNITRISQ